MGSHRAQGGVSVLPRDDGRALSFWCAVRGRIRVHKTFGQVRREGRDPGLHTFHDLVHLPLEVLDVCSDGTKGPAIVR